jgi:hypothetical protein
VAGPLLILGAVALVTESYLFTSRLPSQHDLLVEWLPNFCFLGKSLASGHIPVWNPHVMNGLPFTGDAIHGWMNLEAMATFAALPCGVALRWYLVLQPSVAGLGLYAFLRSEEVSRPAATVGGLVLAMELAGSAYFGVPWGSAYLAWSALLLAALSRYLRSRSWPPRLMWLLLAAAAWGQVIAAHLAMGVVVGTGAALAFVIARVVADVKGGRRSLKESFWLAGLLALIAPLLNLAYLLPVLSNLSTTTLGLGYPRIAALSEQFSHGLWDGGALARAQLRPNWPVQLALSPGLYLGAVPLMLAFAGLWARERRHLFTAFGLFGVVTFVLSLSAITNRVPHFVAASTVGGFYLHHGDRFRDGLLFALPPLIALGVEAWMRRRPLRTRLLMIGPGLAVWVLGPVLLGTDGNHLRLLAAGVGVGALVLAAVATRSRLALLLPAALSVELCASGLLGFTSSSLGSRGHRDGLAPLLPPNVQPLDLASYTREGSIARALAATGTARYLSVGPEARLPSKFRGPEYWPLMSLQRSMLFGLHDAQGYNSNQVIRYWSFVRRVDPKRTWYQGSFFSSPPSIALDLFQVEWAVGPTYPPPPLPGGRAVIREGRWTLYRLPPVPRASVLTAWRVVGSPRQALEAVADAGFDPSHEAILERQPGLLRPSEGSDAGWATYHPRGDHAGLIEAETPAPAIVLVRTTYHSNWRATVDGHPAAVLAADYVDMGIPVQAGRHSISLTYDDRWVRAGLLGSSLTLVLLIGAALALRRKSR